MIPRVNPVDDDESIFNTSSESKASEAQMGIERMLGRRFTNMGTDAASRR